MVIYMSFNETNLIAYFLDAIIPFPTISTHSNPVAYDECHRFRQGEHPPNSSPAIVRYKDLSYLNDSQ